MTMGNKALDYTALTVSLIGAVNWGLIGFFNFNLVSENHAPSSKDTIICGTNPITHIIAVFFR